MKFIICLFKLSIFFSLFASFSFSAADDTMKILKAQMDYIAQRQVLLSENIASVNVDRYKAKDLKSPSIKSLKAYTRPNSFALKTSSPMHIAKKGKVGSSFSSFNPRVTDVRKNGNDVELDDQMLRVADNSDKFNLTTKIYGQMLNLIRTQVTPR
jgi:flagellar basal-body rod protein FlgB